MTRARLALAVAVIITALLLQATVVGPGSSPYPVSLPAVLVALAALIDGPATGIAFGFAIGLVADLGSHHPAGVLALCWLGVGLVCGVIAERRSWWRDVLAVALVCGVASSVATLVLAFVHRGGSAGDAVRQLPVAILGDALIALVFLGIVRAMLRSSTLRAPGPVLTDLTIGGRRG